VSGGEGCGEPKGDRARGVGVKEEEAPRGERARGEDDPKGVVVGEVAKVARLRNVVESACAADKFGWKRSGKGAGATRRERCVTERGRVSSA